MKKDDRTKYKTYGKNRSLRLKGYDYSTPTVYFLTLCSCEGTNPFSDARFARQVVDCLKDCSSTYDYDLLAYCLMPDHLHLLVSPFRGNQSISQYVQAFKSLSTRIFWRSSAKGKLWQRSFYDHIVRKEEDLSDIVKYILANPVRKGLSNEIGKYPFAGTSEDMTVM